MKNNKDFKIYLELVDEYNNAPSKAKKEDVQKEVIKLIVKSWATPTLKIVYDLGIEKYRTFGLNSQIINIYDKAISVRTILKQTYGEFLPRGAMDDIRGKYLVFDPHKPQTYIEDNIDYANLFIKNKFLSFKPQKMIDSIEWDKYPNIKAVFKNVFKTDERMNYFINWLAFGLQTRKKAQTSIISKGTQGTGKGVIYEYIIQYAIGKKYTTLLENEALKSRFNGELENKLFVLANEIKADFREGNTAYERLKMYITDSEIRFEEKNTKARTIPNFFNIWFHSNHDVPLQIQGSDRRYTVFNTKSKKLTEVSKELGYEHITHYLKSIEKERDNFIYDIMSLKYDMHQATTPLSTDEKELIYEASMSKMDVVADKLKKLDIEYFKDVIEDFYESKEIYKNDFKEDLNKSFLYTSNDFIMELSKQIRGNHIKNDIVKFLYKIFVNDTETDRKIGLQFNKHLEKAVLKKINGLVFKYRKIDPDKEAIFLDEPTVDYEDKKGNSITKNEFDNRINKELN